MILMISRKISIKHDYDISGGRMDNIIQFSKKSSLMMILKTLKVLT